MRSFLLVVSCGRSTNDQVGPAQCRINSGVLGARVTRTTFPISSMHAVRPSAVWIAAIAALPAHAPVRSIRPVADPLGVPAAAGTPSRCGRLPRSPRSASELLLVFVRRSSGVSPVRLACFAGGRCCRRSSSPRQTRLPGPHSRVASRDWSSFELPAVPSADRAWVFVSASGVAGWAAVRGARRVDLRFWGLDG